jgi:hypothetical protein
MSASRTGITAKARRIGKALPTQQRARDDVREQHVVGAQVLARIDREVECDEHRHPRGAEQHAREWTFLRCETRRSPRRARGEDRSRDDPLRSGRAGSFDAAAPSNSVA